MQENTQSINTYIRIKRAVGLDLIEEDLAAGECNVKTNVSVGYQLTTESFFGWICHSFDECKPGGKMDFTQPKTRIYWY